MARLRPCLGGPDREPCAARVRSGHCPRHRLAVDRAKYERTADRRRLYASRAWKALRKRRLRENPLCMFLRCGRLATDVDHVIAVEDGGPPLDYENTQSLCKVHHGSKTIGEIRARG